MTHFTPGPRNLITDVAGLKVGNASDARVKTGVTVLTGDAPFTAAVHVMGGAPGTRETDLLAPDKMVQEVDALVLSGGSAFGLDAASGVMDGLRAMDRGFAVAGQFVPIVPAAILFDLANGGAKDWETPPYRALGRSALDAASADFALGSHGAGTGALTATLKGGLGSASVVLPSGVTVGALVAANPVGAVTDAEGRFFGAPFEMAGEVGGHGPARFDPAAPLRTKPVGCGNTTIAIVATDAALTQAEAQRLATAAHDGIGRAVIPAHTPFDGDLVFAAATVAKPADNMLPLCHAAALCLTRAIQRAVYLAEAAEGDVLPVWTAPEG
ncbi:P1 family peptidase [Paracoccaceae bacterium GXU_MW_L88]